MSIALGTQAGERKMRRICSYILATLLLFAVVGCSKPGEQFLGKWLNRTETSKGTMLLDIQRDNDNFILREILVENGATLGVRSAKIVDGYLVVEGGVFKRLTYSEPENALVVLDFSMAIPPFRKVVQESPKTSANDKNKSELSANDVAMGVTSFLQENVPKHCDVKTDEFCGQSMEATTDGFRFRAKTTRPIKSIELNQRMLLTPCALLGVAKAKMPTKLVFEVFSEKEAEVVRMEGTCTPS